MEESHVPHWGMVIDLAKCVGCDSCTVACKAENRTPPGVTYNVVLEQETGAYPNVRIEAIPRPCMQCENPACVSVCPVSATYRGDDGIVVIDADRCIGCKYCIAACPYGARKLNRTSENMFGADVPAPYESYGVQRELVAEKCIFCEARLAEGKQPACVVNCPGRARYFGDLDDPESPVSKFIAGDEAVLRVDETSFYYRPVDGMPLDVLPSNALASSKKGR